ncbi:MAG: bifunctional 5,10-methylenetetrahydrofolate dehydrogenase/5,10-methenyltetrahydrofolate cyclohydrolase, partial [Candidatus Omnitrophica bacterium]|nr:bifunctional 5,10-methylenetetrahydrofolate dehydrogenase/5,10-methenyltetrahydrofolate cyclohydrolase [Candidatus Omnitrophota bacterium]
MKLLEGKTIAEKIKKVVTERVATIRSHHGRPPKLCAVMVGENSAAALYSKAQKRAAREVGIDYELLQLPDSVTQSELEDKIIALNNDATITGVIIQMPLPPHLDPGKVFDQLNPKKDVEGIHADNLGLLVLRKERMPPCTAQAAIELIGSTGVDLYGAEVTIVGSSRIVGRPIALLLLEKMATTTVTHIGTFERGKLEEHVRRADVLIVAVGKAQVIPGDWIKKGAIVIDIGINKNGDKVVGDVDFDSAAKNAAFITPVPGGVGPLTVYVLMRNVIRA